MQRYCTRLFVSLLCIVSLPRLANGADAVAWTNAVNVTVNGNSISKTSGGSSLWNAGAASLNVIRDGYGFVEFTATETNTARMAGLSNGSASENYTEIDFALYLASNGTLLVYENGANRGQVGTYAAGDRLRVQVLYGKVLYFKNGAWLYSSSVVRSKVSPTH